MNGNARDFYLKAIVGIILLIAAIFFQYTAGDVPAWILTAIAGFFAFVLGLSTNLPRN